MRFTSISLGALLLATTAPALAQEAAPAAAPAPAITLNGTATVISDYKFRGISQTDGNFAVQGGLTISHASGFYVSAWGSSVDDYVTTHGTAHQELDLIAGYKHAFKGGVTLDVGALYYVYPGTRPGFKGDTSASDFIEPYASVTYAIGPVSAKATVNYAPKQKALALDQVGPAKDNVYLAGDFSAAIPKSPISVTAHLGHTFGPSWLVPSPDKGYTDWAIGAAYTWKNLSLGVSYVDTDTKYITPTGHDAAKGSILGSIGVSF